jgi:ParB family chromosome partitioning protein
MNKPRLGRGLDALLDSSLTDPLEAPKANQTAVVTTAPGQASPYRLLDVDVIDTGQYQPRTRMSEAALAELAESIKSQGIVQPLVVREKVGGRFELIAGERRWRAAKLAGLSQVPVVVRDIPDEVALAVALIENIQREDLNPIEEAQGIQRLIAEFELSQQQAAQRVGRSRSAVANLLRLLHLELPVREHLEAGRIDMGHARSLLALNGREQIDAAAEVIARQLNVRDTEALVRKRSRGGAVAKPRPVASVNPDTRRLVDQVSATLGAKVKLDDRGGKGRLIIDYHSLEELDGILAHIK